MRMGLWASLLLGGSLLPFLAANLNIRLLWANQELRTSVAMATTPTEWRRRCDIWLNAPTQCHLSVGTLVCATSPHTLQASHFLHRLTLSSMLYPLFLGVYSTKWHSRSGTPDKDWCLPLFTHSFTRYRNSHHESSTIVIYPLYVNDVAHHIHNTTSSPIPHMTLSPTAYHHTLPPPPTHTLPSPSHCHSHPPLPFLLTPRIHWVPVGHC